MFRDQTLLKSSSLLQFVKTESPKVKLYFLKKVYLAARKSKKIQGGLKFHSGGLNPPLASPLLANGMERT
jgi:hypothetical protein